LQHQGFVDAVIFSPDGRTALTGSEDGAIRSWEVPIPVNGRAEQVLLWLEALTGMELDSAGEIRRLDLPTWKQRRQDLQKRDGRQMP
jgi:WD40 repeat protein